jgi:hypothetical protein
MEVTEPYNAPCSPALRLNSSTKEPICCDWDSAVARRSFLFDAFDVSRSRLDGEIARQQIITSITSSDSHDFTARAEIIHVFAQKYLRMCHVFNSLVGCVRKERDVAGAFNRLGQHALMRRTITGDSSRQNLAPFGKVVLQQPHVFKVDEINFVDTKATHASPVNAPAAAASAHWPSIAVIVTIVTAATRTVFIIG